MYCNPYSCRGISDGIIYSFLDSYHFVVYGPFEPEIALHWSFNETRRIGYLRYMEDYHANDKLLDSFSIYTSSIDIPMIVRIK